MTKKTENSQATAGTIIPVLRDDLQAAMAQGIESTQRSREWVAKLVADIEEISVGAGRGKAKREAALASIAETVTQCVTAWTEQPDIKALAESDKDAFNTLRKAAVYNPLRAINTAVGKLFKVGDAPAKLTGNKSGGYKATARKDASPQSATDKLAASLDRLIKEHGVDAVKKGLTAAIKRAAAK